MKCKVTSRGILELGAVLKQIVADGGESAVQKAIDETNIEILSKSQEALNANGSRTTSKLFNSGRVIDAKTTGKGNKFRIQGSVAYDANYAYWVEFGRRAGKQPPVDSLLQWVKKKGVLDAYSIKTQKRVRRTEKLLNKQRSVAFAIAKSIGKKGTKAQPFLKPALLAMRAKFRENLKQHIENYYINVAR